MFSYDWWKANIQLNRQKTAFSTFLLHPDNLIDSFIIATRAHSNEKYYCQQTISKSSYAACLSGGCMVNIFCIMATGSSNSDFKKMKRDTSNTLSATFLNEKNRNRKQSVLADGLQRRWRKRWKWRRSCRGSLKLLQLRFRWNRTR